MELVDLDDFDVDAMWHGAAALDARTRLHRELALQLRASGLLDEARTARQHARDTHAMAQHVKDLCARAWLSRYDARRTA